MLSKEQIDRIAPNFKIIKIITFGIIMGALMFGVVIAMIVDWDDVTSELKMITLFGSVTAISLYVLSFIIPPLMASSSASSANLPVSMQKLDSEEDKHIGTALQTIFTSHITHCAMVEGGIFLNLMVFMVERSLISLAVAGLGLGILLAAFPFDSKLISRIENLLPSIEQEEQLKR